MSQEQDGLRGRTSLSPGHAPLSLLPFAAPFAASMVAHAAVVATLAGRNVAPVVSAEPPAGWVEAPEAVDLEPAPPPETGEGPEEPVGPAGLQSEPTAGARGEATSDVVNLPPPDAIPGIHGAAQPLVAKARADWWAAAGKVSVGLDSRDSYDAIRAQIAGWNPKLVTGTYVPGGARIKNPDEMPSKGVPVVVVSGVVQSYWDRFHVCHGVGLPESRQVGGKVLVAFDLQADGTVANASDAGGYFPDPAVRRCVVRTLSRLPFPKPPLGLVQHVTVPVLLPAEEAIARPDPREPRGESTDP